MTQPAGGTATGLNANQVRAVVTRFAYMDGLLTRLEELARGAVSPFDRERPDLTPDEAARIGEFVTLARTELAMALDRLGIEHPVPDGSARWSAKTMLTFAEVALGDLTVDFLRGYGKLGTETAAIVEAVNGRLRAVIAGGRSILRENADADRGPGSEGYSGGAAS